MSRLRKISLVSFRNYTHAQFFLDSPVTCITGANGSGKTNLLDAVYYLCYTKSYFTSNQQQNARHGADGFRIEGNFEKENNSETVACKWKGGKKEISANGLVYERPIEHIGRYAAVMVAPDDVEVINEGSEPRRKFVDSILSQCDRQYFEYLLDYQRVLLQRNALLKMYAGQTEKDTVSLHFYDRQLATGAQYIYNARCRFADTFLPLLQQYYQLLSASRELATLRYVSDLHQQSAEAWLEKNLYNDIRFQRTLRGIHKDDLEFLLDGFPARNFGSQGQKKSFLFSLKLAQYEYLSRQSGNKPILLLDDIFEKLDQQRMEALLGIIRGDAFGQVILTDTHEDRVKVAFGSEDNINFIRL